ncbi:pilus assembly protein PilM [Candidatus Dependentiae bacterium]|nr:pilus assembly protein PilM [Candidatus Dependentiae bacterium]
MMHDLFIPCRIGNYYLHTKKILTIEITPVVVYGLLFECVGKKIILKDSYTVSLKEDSLAILHGAIKKIISSAGKIDEIISICAASAMIFKELRVPFLGRENIEVVLPLEIENMLPFPLDQAIIDFIITDEDLDKKVSTILVCAVRRHDIDEQYELFKKADVSLDMLTVDVFGLYRLYQIYAGQNDSVLQPIKNFSLKEKLSRLSHALYSVFIRKKNDMNSNYSHQILQSFHANTSEVLVDIGYSSIKVLYMKNRILYYVRLIPFGVEQILSSLEQQSEKRYEDIIHVLSSDGQIDSIFSEQLRRIFEEVSRTLLYFQQQEGGQYLSPSKIMFTGFFTNFIIFTNQAKSYFGSIVSSVDMSTCLARIPVINNSKTAITSQQFSVLSSGLLWYFHKENNLLKDVAEKKELRVTTLQLLVMFLVSILSIGGVWWRSSEQIQRWQTAYSASRKQLLIEIQGQMGLDLYGEKNLKTLVQKTEDVLSRERQLWFSFTQKNEASILEYLQDLSLAIDREAIGLELKNLHIDYQKIIMTGTVKGFSALDVFYEELQELKLLKLVDRPMELSWTIELKPKVILKGAS